MNNGVERTETELMPCPFCGGEAKLIKGLHSVDGDVYTLYGVSCLYGDSDQAALDGAYGVEHSIFGYFFEYQAIEAWNTRAQGTCEVEGYDDGVDEGMDGEWYTYGPPTWYLSCGHETHGSTRPCYCCTCGRKVEE